MNEYGSIKPIETEYDGYRFRSRLEARWAVFFNAARIRYEYEPEGFTLDSRTKYLPDFYLPEFDLFVEIKPRGCKDKEEAWEDTCRRFRSSAGRAILIKYGDPADNIWGRLFAFKFGESGGGEFEEEAQFVPAGDFNNPEVIVMTFAGREQRVCVTPDMQQNKKVVGPAQFMEAYWEDAACTVTNRMTEMFNEDDLPGTFNDMRKMARQARFEHGEKPKGMQPTAETIRKTNPALYALGAALVKADKAGAGEFLAEALNRKCAELGYDTGRVYREIREHEEARKKLAEAFGPEAFDRKQEGKSGCLRK